MKVAIVLALSLAPGLAAQDAAPLPVLDSGAIVRFQLRSGNQASGKLLAPFARDSTRFRFCTYPAPPCGVGGDRYHEQLASDLVGVDVRRGTKAVPGLVLGAALGVGVGFAAVSFDESMSEHTLSTFGKVKVVGIATLIVAGLGWMIGGGIDEWGTAP